MATIIKTEHAGAKNGGGYYGKRAEAKRVCRSKRRANGKREIRQQLCAEPAHHVNQWVREAANCLSVAIVAAPVLPRLPRTHPPEDPSRGEVVY